MFTLAQPDQFFKNIWVKRILSLSLINSKSDDDTKEAWDKKQGTAPGTLWWLMQHSPKQPSNFLCEKILENGDIDQCLCCICEHLFCSSLFLALGELGWCNHCNQLEPGKHRALLKSLKMCLCHPLYQQECEGEVVTSLEKSWHLAGVSMVFHQLISLQSQCLATSKSHGAAETRRGNDRQSLVGRACPLCCLPGACPPADIPSLQPPPVPWLREPAEVQPTFATCHGKMSQSLRLLTMTQAQLTHVCLVRGIGAAAKCCTSDWCAKFHFTCCKEKLCPLSLSSRQFLIGFFFFVSCNFIVICSINESVCVLTGEKKLFF